MTFSHIVFPRERKRQRVIDIAARDGDCLHASILFRNTAMYLKPEATAALWERFEQSLRPGGVLVLGKAERPVGAKRLSLLGHCMYRRNRR